MLGLLSMGPTPSRSIIFYLVHLDSVSLLITNMFNKECNFVSTLDRASDLNPCCGWFGQYRFLATTITRLPKGINSVTALDVTLFRLLLGTFSTLGKISHMARSQGIKPLAVFCLKDPFSGALIQNIT